MRPTNIIDSIRKRHIRGPNQAPNVDLTIIGQLWTRPHPAFTRPHRTVCRLADKWYTWGWSVAESHLNHRLDRKASHNRSQPGLVCGWSVSRRRGLVGLMPIIYMVDLILKPYLIASTTSLQTLVYRSSANCNQVLAQVSSNGSSFVTWTSNQWLDSLRPI